MIDSIKKVLREEYGFYKPELKRATDGIGSRTYFVSEGKNRYVLKIFNNYNKADIISNFQQSLYSSNIPVPKVYKTNDGEYAARLNHGALMVYEYINGTAISWDDIFSTINTGVTKDLATAMAKIHLKNNINNDIRSLDNSLSINQLKSKLIDNVNLKKLLQDLKLENVRKSLIHGDIARENIFVNGLHNSLRALIDFGDLHYDYISYDIATALTQVYVTKSWGVDSESIGIFLNAYNKVNELSMPELKTIVPLMLVRNTGLLQEIEVMLYEGTGENSILESIRGSLLSKIKMIKTNEISLNKIVMAAYSKN